MVSPLLDALEDVAVLVNKDGYKYSVEDGRFYLNFLGVNVNQNGQSDDKDAWRIVQERIETLFGPNLLPWNLIGMEHQNVSKRRQSVRMSISSRPRIFYSEDFTSDKEPQELKLFHAKVALLSLYIAAVHDHKEDLWGALASNLNNAPQIKIQKAFEYLLEHRRSMNPAKLELLFASTPPCSGSSAFSTPYRATPTSGLGESFTYSPSTVASSPASSVASGATSPLQDFFKSQKTKQILEKLQKELRDAKSALDNEKGETVYLKSELESVLSEKEKLKQDLEVTRSKLFVKSNGQQSIISSSDYEMLQQRCTNLQQKLSDLKDSNKYMKTLEGQLETTLAENRELVDKYEGSQSKLNDKSSNLKLIENKLTDAELKTMNLGSENDQLRDNIKELNKQIAEMQAISSDRQSMIFELGGDNLNDISLDNPRGIMSPPTGPTGESMGDMVVLGLQEEISTLKSQISSLEEKYHNAEKVNRELQANGEKLQEDLQSLRAELENSAENLTKVQHEKMGLESIVSQKSEEILNLQSESAKIMETFKSKQQENYHIKTSFNKVTEELAITTTGLNQMKEENCKNLETISALEKKVKTVINDQQNLNIQLEKSSEELINQKMEKQSLLENYENLQQHIVIIEEEKNQVEKEKLSIEDRLKVVQGGKDVLAKDFAIAEDKISTISADAQKDLDAKQEEIQLLKSNLEDLIEKQNILQENLAKMEAQSSEYKTQISDLEGKFQASEKTNLEFQAEKEQLGDELQSIQLQLDESAQNLCKAQNEKMGLENIVSQKTDAVLHLETENAKIVENLRCKHSENDQLQASFNKITEELSFANNNLNQLKEEKSKSLEKISSLDKNVQEAAKDLQNLENQLKKSSEELLEQKREKQNLSENFKKLQQQIVIIEEEKSKLKDKKSQNLEHISSLEKKVEEAAINQQNLGNQLKKSSEELLEQKREKQNLSENCEKLQQQIVIIEEENSKLKEEKSQNLEHVSSLKKKFEEAAIDQQNLGDQLKNFSEELMEQKAEKQSLSENYERLQQQINIIQEEKIKVEKEKLHVEDTLKAVQTERDIIAKDFSVAKEKISTISADAHQKTSSKQEEIQNLKSTIDKHVQRQNLLEENLTKMEAQSSEEKAQISALQESLTAVNTEKSELEIALNDKISKENQLIAELEKNKDLKDSCDYKIQLLTKDLKETKNIHETLINDVAVKKDETLKTLSDFNALKEKYSNLVQFYEEEKEEKSQLESMLNNAQQKLDEVSNQFDQATKEKTTSLEALKSQLKESVKAKDDLLNMRKKDQELIAGMKKSSESQEYEASRAKVC